MIISVILTILKIIGIVLLCLLGLVLFLFLSVLFVPIRYRFDGSFDQVLYFKAKITWFLHVISMSVLYKDNKPVMKLKVFGIPLSFLQKAGSEKTEKKKKKKIGSNQSSVNASKELKTAVPLDEPIKKEKIEGNHKEDKHESSKPVETNIKNINKEKTIFNRIKNFIYKIINTFVYFINKIKQIKENIAYYIEILESEETKAAFKTCKYRLGKLIHHIIPKKFQIHVSYGLEDPSTTAKILAVHSMFYAYIGNYVFLHPDFEEQKLIVQIKGKGRITSAVMGYHFLRVYFDRNCKNFMNLFKKESLDE